MGSKETEKYIKQIIGTKDAFSPGAVEDSELSKEQQAFLAAYSSNGGITKSALRTSGVSRKSLDEWKTTSEPFKKALKIAEEHWVEELRKAAFLRAQAKSDVLLMFLLKALKPEEFDDDVRKSQYTGLSANPNNIPVRATLVRDNNIHISLHTDKAEELRDILTIESQDTEE